MKKLALIATISIMLALMATSLVSVSPVRAATITLIPNADATGEINLSIGGSSPASTNWDSVNDDPTPDDDVTYVYNATSVVKTDLYELPDSPTPLGKINSVSVYIRCIESGTGGTAYTHIKTSGDVATGTTDVATPDVWNTDSQVYTLNPVTGVVWTWQEINLLQAGVSAKKADCTQVYVVVDHTPPTWESYKTVAHSIIWGSETDQYDSANPTAYMYGDNFTANNHPYHVAYYDATVANGGTQIKSEGVISSVNALSYDCQLDYNTGATPGPWHAVVFDDDLGAPPSTYNECASAAGYLVEDSLWVAQSAIPEFPTIFAAIAVAGLCFGIYWWMRKRRLEYVKA